MTTDREPDTIERMAIEHQNALAADWGARKWFQLATTDEREASVRAMLAAVRVLQSILKDHDRISAVADLRDIIADHERRAGGKDQ